MCGWKSILNSNVKPLQAEENLLSLGAFRKNFNRIDALIVIPKSIVDKMITHARREYPNECCGLLSGQDGKISFIYKIENEDKSPDTYFMNPKELLDVQKNIRGKSLELIGIYHSHTHSDAYPSKTDIEKAYWPESDLPLFPESFYFIISLKDLKKPVIRVFDIKNSRIEEKKLNIVNLD